MSEEQQGAPASVMTQPQEAEKMVPQSHLNSIVGEAKQKAREQGYQQARSEMAQAHSNVPHGTNLSADEVARIAEEKASATYAKNQRAYEDKLTKDAQEKQAQSVLNSIAGKMADARTRYPDYDDTVKTLGLDKIPQLLWLAHEVPNSADVLYDLGKNPDKVGSILSQPPHLAVGAMQRLSQSIQANQKAATTEIPNEPGSQIKPSNAGSDKLPSGGAGYRAKYRGIG